MDNEDYYAPIAEKSVHNEKCVVGHVATEECLNAAAAFMDL